MLPPLKLTLLLASLTICESSIVYTAQCRSKCYSMFTKDEPSLSQCLTPCLETDLSKLKSCFSFCQSQQTYGSACHFSCKFLKELHYKGHLPGKCSLVKPVNGKYCSGNRNCEELTKCCYNYCEDISVPGEGVTITINNITSSSMSAYWQESNIADAVYILQVRDLFAPSIYYYESDWGDWRQLEQLSDTNAIILSGIHPGAKLQLRIAVVNCSGLQSIGPPTRLVRTLFNASRPSGPQVIWAEIQSYKQDEVELMLSWMPPEQLDIPVHRYRIYWSETSQITSKVVTGKKQTRRVQGMQLNYTIKGLKKDKNYLVEIQAICLWKKKRLKSPKVAVNVSTSGMKGTNVTKIKMISNTSKLKSRHVNFTIQDEDFKGIKVIVERHKVHKETAKTTPRSPHEVGKTKKNSGSGTKSNIWTSMLLLSMSCVVYLFV